ncbi:MULTISPECIES: cytochrome c550 [Bacillales]|uniref:cytochrome c550 n=1 Tax=Bacillales TaxID=1385 RepID=UPI001883E281|nr:MULTISPECIES: cytochrome c [Bacillaceae]MBF0706522.1 cytochrome c [Pseudalkalibacillus hwajinpoensis]MDO6655062.1 cytochrome c [Anaerobacillus sp. 1_MG-2023]WLR60570.1 cytochrome c [Pseudalkalibacillus hwajinpoensis]
MKKNPLIPFAWTAVIGLILIIGVSFWALQQGGEESAEGEGEKQEQAEAAAPEDIYAQNCASCHGGDLGGQVGPALNAVGGKYSKDEILDIINNGKGSGMPAGVIQGEQAEAVAQWLSEKK